MATPAKSLFRAVSLSASVKVYLSANALLRAAGVGRGILLTWLMRSQAEFGVYQLGLLAINLLLPVLSLGAYEGIARYVPAYESRGQLWRFLRAVLPACVVIGVALCALLVVLSGAFGALLFGSLGSAGHPVASAWSEASDRDRVLRMVAVCVAVLVLYHTVLAVLRGRRMFRAVSVMELMAGLLFTAAAVLAGVLQRGTGLVVLGVYAGANLVTAAAFAVPALSSARLEPAAVGGERPAGMLRTVLRFSLWAGWAAFFWQLLLVFPALQLNRVCGEEVLAIYRAMTIFTQLGYIAPAAVSVAVLSAVAKTWESQGRQPALDRLELAGKATLAATLIGCLIMAMLKGALMLAFPPTYADGQPAVNMLLLFYITAGALSFVTIRFTLIKQSRLTFLCWVSGCVVSVLLSLVLIRAGDPAQAVVRAAWAGAGGAATALGVALLQLHRRRLMPDRGTLFLLAGSLLLAARPLHMAAGAIAIILLCCSTELIFTSRQRQTLLTQAASALGITSTPPPAPGSDNDDA